MNNDYLSYLETIRKIKNLSDNEKIQELGKITIIKKYSKNKYVVSCLASLYVKEKQFDKSERIYKNLEANSNGADTFNKKSLGFLYIKWDKYDEGVKILLDIIEIYIKEKPFQKLLDKGITKSLKKEKYINELNAKVKVSQEVKKNYLIHLF